LGVRSRRHVMILHVSKAKKAGHLGILQIDHICLCGSDTWGLRRLIKGSEL
jgi:hypothetical protein